MDDIESNHQSKQTRQAPCVLFAGAFGNRLRARVTQAFNVIGPFAPPIAGHLDPAEAPKIRALVTAGNMETDAAMMDLFPNLDLICCLGSGYERLDIQAAMARGIMVTHCPEVNAGAVADHALALLLAVNRKIISADKFVREGEWHRGRMPPVRGLEGRRAGIYGFGAIGEKIAARCAAFDMQIAYYSRSAKPVPYDFHGSLQSLAGWADILMVAVRADAGNRHSVDKEIMQALGPEGILVNISRGSVVDETALIALLQSRQLGAAGLDVFEHEPSVPDALKALGQVVMTPHVGGGTLQAIEAMQDLIVANIAAFFAGHPVLTPVPEMKPLSAGF